ncbi:MAG: sulfite exporter TauE/SafE family protein [Oscillospiraceae bacterium]|nr:sulfite exporter TauE/SafE family protein [Oscillospiraceae bacterium]
MKNPQGKKPQGAAPGNKPPIFKCAVTGILAGCANGLFGSGGGMFIVPLYTKWCGFDEKKTFASSIAVILPLSVMSIVVYAFCAAVPTKQALPYIVGGTIGSVIGGKCFKKVPVNVLRKIFAAFLIFGGAKALFFS